MALRGSLQAIVRTRIVEMIGLVNFDEVAVDAFALFVRSVQHILMVVLQSHVVRLEERRVRVTPEARAIGLARKRQIALVLRCNKHVMATWANRSTVATGHRQHRVIIEVRVVAPTWVRQVAVMAAAVTVVRRLQRRRVEQRAHPGSDHHVTLVHKGRCMASVSEAWSRMVIGLPRIDLLMHSICVRHSLARHAWSSNHWSLRLGVWDVFIVGSLSLACLGSSRRIWSVDLINFDVL